MTLAPPIKALSIIVPVKYSSQVLLLQRVLSSVCVCVCGVGFKRVMLSAEG